NDADFGNRQHQLVWNNVRDQFTPWSNFHNLGKFKLKAKTINYDNNTPSAPGIPTDVGEYTNDTLVVFNWTKAEDFESGISTYHLQVGTFPDGNDIFDKWIGNVLTDTITGSHEQTLYARVKAQDRAGNLSDWSAASDGITIDVTDPTAPGKPKIEFTILDSVTFTWTAADDPESGIVDYFLQVGTAMDDSSIHDGWIESNDTTFTIKRPDSKLLFARVKAKNGAGSTGTWSDYGTLLKTNIVFAFDLSQNMAGQIEAMKQAVMTAMNEITTAGIDAHFGVTSFVDHLGSYNSCNYSAQYGVANDFPWKIDQKLTNDTSLVKIAINDLQTYSGADGPQAYTRSLLECLFLKWRSDSRKLIVMIGNAPAHDCDFFSTSYGADPGPDAQMGTCDDLDYEEVVDWVDKAGISIISIDNSSGTSPTPDHEGDAWKNFEYMAVETGGKHLLKGNWQEVSLMIEELIEQGPKADTLYPWIIEAEEMQNRIPLHGSPCENGWRLAHQDQSIYQSIVFLTDSLYHFNVTAKAEIGGNAAPWLKVQVGDEFEGTCEINSTEWQDYDFYAPIPKGFHCISLTFLNDSWIENLDDRNLLLDKITIDYSELSDQPPISYTFEAENMCSQHDDNYKVGNYMVLCKPHAFVAQDMFFEKQELKFVIFAKGDSSEGAYPMMDLWMGPKGQEVQVNVNPIIVDAEKGYELPLLTDIESGKCCIKITYSGPCVDGRNLYIDKLVIYTTGGLLKPINEPLNDEEITVAIPEKYALDQNYPNPFNPDTHINYQLPEESHVVIKIYNTLGQEIRTLLNENKPAGYYRTIWNGLDSNGNQVVSGIYLYQIKAGSFVCTKKMAFLK
ncbi:MAG: T9SS type A sorting domain-containing protein, partial [bacterium]